MALIINKNIHNPYTRKEIMEKYEPVLWKQANECIGKLKDLQEKVLPVLQISWKQIPDHHKETSAVLKEKQVQLNLWEYLYFKSLYCFAEQLCKTIHRQCYNLAEAKSIGNQGDAVKAEEVLENILSVASTIDFDELVNDYATGVLRLKSLLKRFKGKPSDFTVLTEFGERRTWLFKDIIGSIENYGLGSSIFVYTNADYLPTQSNIGTLLDDDEMKRIY